LEDSFAAYPQLRHDLVTEITSSGLPTADYTAYVKGPETLAYADLTCARDSEAMQLLHLLIYRGIAKILVGRLARHKQAMMSKVEQGNGRQAIRFLDYIFQYQKSALVSLYYHEFLHPPARTAPPGSRSSSARCASPSRCCKCRVSRSRMG